MLSIFKQKLYRSILTGLLIFGLLTVISCVTSSKNENEQTLIQNQITLDKNEVTILVLKKEKFKKEIISNGKLLAMQKNQLKFNVGETLEKIYVSNGAIVKKGQLLAKLDNSNYLHAVNEAKINVKRLELDFQDKLIGRGYYSLNKDSIPSKEYNVLSVKTGYTAALHALKKAELELNATRLSAPFDGKIANVMVKQFDQVNANENVISIIDDKIFEVEFYLIEEEIKQIKINMEINILPMALDKIYVGKINSINPQVENDGTILVKARVRNDGNLIDGMNTKVIVEQTIPDQFIIPKTALVLRQNQEVVFKVKSGKAYWTYVMTTNENNREYCIVPDPNKSNSTLEENDSIVISGSLSLAHQSEVLVNDNSITN